MDFLKKFFQLEAASGILLLFCTLFALLIANSSISEIYLNLLHTNVLGLSYHHWINDGLMAIFFFLVGMEIKYELAVGELSTAKKASLPILAAMGGMVFPALIYHFFNPAAPSAHGWGIPMATDIAFAVCLLSLFGKRVPFSLKIFLLALAIADDLGAVMVIAFFYTQSIAMLYLLAAIPVFLLIPLAQRFRFSCSGTYIVLGTVAWFLFLRSGVHATIAGVILGLLVPIKFQQGNSTLKNIVGILHPYVNFLIMPIFALANAGVDLRGTSISAALAHPVALGVALGLLLGKPCGIFLLSWLGVFFKLGELPLGVNWKQILAVGFVAGIGFTMALFVSSLALAAELEPLAKVGILAGSLASAVVGALIFRISLKA